MKTMARPGRRPGTNGTAARGQAARREGGA